MSRGRVHPRTVLQWLLALALLVTLGVVLGQLRRAAPHDAPTFALEGVEDLAGEGAPTTCERTSAGITADTEGTGPPTAGRVSSSQVVECPAAFDGRTVTYVGEVIGDVLRRDGGAWVLMNDDAYALEAGPLRSHGRTLGYNSGLSVWLDDDLLDLVDETGGPHRRGDILRVRGVVHRADPADGGGLTIRAAEGELLLDGEPVEVPVHTGQAIAAGVLALAAVAAVLLERRSRRRR